MSRFDSAYEEIKKLVERFEKGIKHYTSPAYQESEARQDFIDDFFIALGWDVRHREQQNPYEQEVKIEKSQKQQEAKAQKRADYAFYLAPNFKDEKFFAEAKKPSVGLRNEDHYFQTIRYGWSANTPVAILTDFEELHILDCRIKPNPRYIFNGQHREYRYNDYLDKEKFAEIYFLFSRESLANGSLEKYAASLPKPKGKVVQKALFKGGYKPIDEDFLEYIDAIREDLAKAFKKNDESLNGEELTEAVQRTIDRLVFIRFLEDKLIEPENHVSEWTGWKDFISDCRKLDVKYNGVVFKKHFIDDQHFAGAEERLFIDICGDISNLNSPYQFNYLPIHILGSIYERFLGKVVVSTDKRVRIEEKPEVRKAGGVYYTPKYIVDYIVANTVGKLIEGKTPKEISEMHFADIACGSGSFLIGVYDLLLEYHKKYYNEKLTDKTEIDGRSEDFGNVVYKDKQWILTLKLKQEILLKNIYGVDIDGQAAEVTQLSLFLKMLEEETFSSTHLKQGSLFSKVLPDLSKNIVVGNSLVEPDISAGKLFSDEEEKDLYPFSFDAAFPKIFNKSKFDCIVGNPPFIQLSADSNLNPALKKYLIEKYGSSMGRLNTFGFFIKRAIDLIQENGFLGYIIPNTITTQDYYQELREMILKACKINAIVNFDKLPFKDAVVENVILTLEKSKRQTSRDSNKIDIVHVNENFEFKITKKIEQSTFNSTPNNSFNILVNKASSSLKTKIEKNCIALGEFLEVNQAIALRSDRSKWVSNRKVNSNYKPLLVGGKNINRYSLEWDGTYLNYDLNGIHSCKREDIFLSDEKILFRRVANRLIATIDTNKFYGLHTLVVMNNKPDNKLSLKFFLGVFNSKLMSYYYKETFASTKTVFSEVGARQVKQLPIKPIDLKNAVSKKMYQTIVDSVEEILKAKEKLKTSKTDKDRVYLESKCATLDRMIDKTVYDLYTLSKEEIDRIENS